MFTQAQVNSMIAAQKRELQAKYEAKAQPPQPKQPEPAKKPATGSNAGDEIMQRMAEFEQQLKAERTARQFAEAAIAAGVTPDQAKALKPMYEAISPDDGAAWIKQTMDAFGVTAAAKPDAGVPHVPPTQPPSAPGATTAFDRDQISIGDLTAEQVAATDPARLLAMAKKKFLG